MLKLFRTNFSFWILGSFWLISLLNPVFKKYDYGAEYPIVLLFAALLSILVFVEFRREREESPWMNLERISIFIFGLFITLSFAFSQAVNVGFSELLAFLTIIIFHLIYGGQKIPWMKKFLNVVKAGTMLAVILGFVLYFWRGEPRMAGPFFNILYHANVWPNAFALFLLMVWPLFVFYERQKSRGRTLFHLVLLSFVLAALLLTFSRGALIVFGGQSILLIIYFFRRITRYVLIGALLLVLMTGTIFLGANYSKSLNHKVIDVQERITFANSESLTSKRERLDFWAGAWQLAGEKPLLGWGPFSFRYAYNPIQKTLLGSSDHPHNIFLKIAVENGFPALLAFLAFLLTILVVVARRFRKLEQSDRDTAFMLAVCVAGAFAHNLIDYNFNFFANLLLLFIFLIFLRSIVVEKVASSGRVSTLILSLFLALIAIFEGSILAMDYLKYSFYPRGHFLKKAELAISKDNFNDALLSLDKQLILNPLDARARHAMGVIYCDENYAYKDHVKCSDLVAQAIELNPKNNFSYYVDYFRPLVERGVVESFEVQPGRQSVYETMLQSVALLNEYFGYVENNVHFTAYTENVEAAAKLVDILIVGFKFSGEEVQDLLAKKEKMLKTAERLRNAKTF